MDVLFLSCSGSNVKKKNLCLSGPSPSLLSYISLPEIQGLTLCHTFSFPFYSAHVCAYHWNEFQRHVLALRIYDLKFVKHHSFKILEQFHSNLSHRYLALSFLINIGASSWDYGTYHIGDEQRLGEPAHLRYWRACTSAVSPEPSLFAVLCLHTWSIEVDERSDQTSSPTGWLPMCVWRMSLRISFWCSFKKWILFFWHSSKYIYERNGSHAK